LLAGFFLGAGLRRGLVLRVAVLVPVFFAGPREVLAVRVEDVLLLRDPGGEDVRVAIWSTYTAVTPVTWTPRACLAGRSPPCRWLRRAARPVSKPSKPTYGV